MVAIPQIYRDKIASSVVGTPGVDPSAQATGEGIDQGAQQTADAGFSIAIDKQNLRNEGEFASLMVQHSQNIMSAAEQIKKTYADDPDKMPGALSNAIGSSLSAISQKASNPMVKLMVERGDPSAQMWAMRQIQQDAYEQGWRNTLVHATNTIDGLTQQSEKMGNNLDMSADDMVKNTAPLAHVMGQLFTSIDSSAHQQVADEVSNKGMMSIMKGLVDTTMEQQPVKASQLLQNPEVAKWFPPDQIKKYQADADAAVKNYPKKIMEQQIQSDLASHPNFVNGVISGQNTYSDIDRMQRIDQTGLHDSTYNYLKDIALGTGPAAEYSAQEVKAQFVDEASKLGFKLKDDPSFVSKIQDRTAIMSDNIKDLYKFQDDLLDARRRNVISKDEFNTYYNKLYTPLVASTMKNHDPNFWNKLVADPQNLNYGKNEMPGKVDDFKGAYHVIENYIGYTGADKKYGPFVAKSAFYDSYFKALDANKGKMMPNTNNPWTPRETAYSVLGISTGNTYNFPGFGMRVITGHDEDGTPTFQSTKDDDDRLANARAMKALQKQKAP